jgi:uncharacterized protein
MSRAWQRMLSGRRLDLLDPSPFDIEIEDIAHGLSRVSRWNGQTLGEHSFSVAQHSVLVLDIFCAKEPQSPATDQLHALLHDAPEYVIGDLISPFKTAVGMDYKSLERKLERAVHLRFGLKADPGPDLHKRIKVADITAAYWEATLLAGFDLAEAEVIFGNRPSGKAPELVPLSAVDAKSLFMSRFKGLLAQT